MTYILVFALLFGLGAAWGAWLYLDTRRRKNARIQLRLAVGRSRLLQEEIARRTQALKALDLEAIATARQQAESAIDALQIFLVERQAHLQDREELGYLQRTKIALQEKQVATLAHDAVAAQPRPAIQKPLPRNRSNLESQLLNKIGSIQQKARKPPDKPPQ